MGEARFVFWDVQHGSAAYIQTPNGKHIVIDLGTGKVKAQNMHFSPLFHLKHHHDVERLDYLVITHPHRDHLDDISNLRNLDIGILLRPTHLAEQEIRSGNQLQDLGVIHEYLELHGRFSAPVTAEQSLFEPANLGGLSIQSFIPTTCPRANLNNHSLVLVASYAGLKIIIPGDNEAPSWQELLQRQDFRQAIAGTDILVASHHGRQAGFSSELFEYIEPRLVVVSDGPASDTSATARYRHPNSDGWTVFKRSSGESQTRWVLTTRGDGVIVVRFGIDGTNGRNYLNVTVD